MKTYFFLRQTAFKALVLTGLIMSGFTASAQREKLQTAFVYQLTRLIEWCPDGKTGNFVIGVVGDYPLLVTELSALQSRRVGEQTIEVKSFTSIDAATKSNILFIPSARATDIKAAAAKIGSDCTLIISDQEGGVDLGAGVSIIFIPETSKIQYEINKRYMSKYSLNVNDQLYKLASKIY